MFTFLVILLALSIAIPLGAVMGLLIQSLNYKVNSFVPTMAVVCVLVMGVVILGLNSSKQEQSEETKTVAVEDNVPWYEKVENEKKEEQKPQEESKQPEEQEDYEEVPDWYEQQTQEWQNRTPSNSSSSSTCLHYESGECWDEVELAGYDDGYDDGWMGMRYGASFFDSLPASFGNCTGVCEDIYEDAYQEGYEDGKWDARE